jgi:hypothetical protein
VKLLILGLTLTALASPAGATKCGTGNGGNLPNVVVSRLDPPHSSKMCWELRIARGGDNHKIDIECVSKSDWDKHPKGSNYP